MDGNSDKQKGNSITLGIGALLALVVSLPLEWLTIHRGTMQLSGEFQGFGSLPSSMGAMSFALTGFNGHITFLVKLPIWFIVLTGMTGVLLAILNRLGTTSFPRLMPLLFLSLSSVYVVMALVLALGSSDASAGVGTFVALIGLALGFVHALTPSPSSRYSST